MTIQEYIAIVFVSLTTMFVKADKLSGQELDLDSIYPLPELEILESQGRSFHIGSQSQRWSDSTLGVHPAQNIADLLGTETGAYIKSYGLGSLATSSVRGGSARHTLVMWNGLPVQSPLLGLLDLSMLPVLSAERIEFVRGGSTSINGSGAIGGVLSMDNLPDFSRKRHLSANTEWGSFGHQAHLLQWGLGSDRFQAMTKLYYNSADNDFSYFQADGLPERLQINAQIRQALLSQDLYFKINDHNTLELHYWLQGVDRGIPPTNVQNQSLATQKDLVSRLMLGYTYVQERGVFQVKAGYFAEWQEYTDELILLESANNFGAWMLELTERLSLYEDHELLLGSMTTYTIGSSSGFGMADHRELRTAFFGSWRYSGRRFRAEASLRWEQIDRTMAPIAPTVGLEYELCESLIASAKWSRNYQFPGFNDRFWVPGGNPDLLPESGWSQEMTLSHSKKKSGLEYSFSLTGFHRRIDNWILWAALEGEFFFSATNVAEVWSRGLEPRVDMSLRSGAATWTVRGGYDYILSTNEIALINPQIDKGSQLIYTPEHQAFLSMAMNTERWRMVYQHDFAGRAQGLLDPIAAFDVGNLQLQYSPKWGDWSGRLYIHIHNLWDRDYLVIERRPMPGRHFRLGFNIDLTSFT